MAKNLGKIFEKTFVKILDFCDFEEGIDYRRGRLINPDFYFFKSKTFIEIKFNSEGKTCYTPHQQERFKELIDKGFKIKTLVFSVRIEEPFQGEGLSLLNFIKQLKILRRKNE